MGLPTSSFINCDVLFLKLRGFQYWWCRPEIRIKPWTTLKEELKEGNNRTKWVNREPYAYWRGNIKMGKVREELSKCTHTDEQDWNARIYNLVTHLFHHSQLIFLFFSHYLYVLIIARNYACMQDWGQETVNQFSTSELSNQCTHK